MPYALFQPHKHIPEMVKYAGLEHEPVFIPAVGPFRCGMRVQVPLPAALFPGGYDEREFWQRVDARNRETAAQADRLGLAEYYAMEAYVVRA